MDGGLVPSTCLSALVADQCLNSAHWQLTDLAMRVQEDVSVMSNLSGASLHPLLGCLDMLSMFTGHVYIGKLLAEVPKLTIPRQLLEQDT